MSDSSYILKLQGITKRFSGVTVLNNVCFDLKLGEVHALIGENGAGKSTLMNILLGVIPADSGEIYYRGNKVHFSRPLDALEAGISMIHQEISLMGNMTVSENVWIGRENLFKRNGLLDKKLMQEKTDELLNKLNISLDSSSLVKDLSVANMQMVELARAVSYDSKIIIMDEPTSALTQTEIDVLYRIVKNLAANNTAVIFISHKLNEIYDLCDRVTVLRDGNYIATHYCSEITMNELIKLIVGRELTQMYPPKSDNGRIGEVVLEVSSLEDGKKYHDISFYARKGEIVGFCGLMGAGRTEIMSGLFGIVPYSSGKIKLHGDEVTIHSPIDAIKNKVGMVTEDRLHLGGMRDLSVKVNMTIVKLKELLSLKWFINSKEETRQCQDMIEHLNVKTSSMNQLIGHLSGGNQQKAIIGKWLMKNPDVLIMDEPTRGIDIGSKYEIYSHIISLAEAGMTILMVSSELSEILGMSDRIYVVRNGTIVAEHINKNLTQEILIAEEFGAETENTI